MLEDIKSIINNARNRETAIANFNANIASGKKLDKDEFYRRLDSRFPIRGAATTTPETSTTTGPSSGVFEKLEKGLTMGNDVIKALAGGIQSLYKSQITDKTYLNQDFDKLNTIFESIVKNGINPFKNGVEFVKIAGSEILKQLQAETDARYTINRETTLTGKLSEALIEDLQDASREAIRFGYTLENITELYTTMVTNSGKLALINKQTVDEISPVAAALNMRLSEFAATATDFEKVGIGLDGTTKFLDALTPKTLSLGLSSAKVAKDLKDNIGTLNQYGFKNGVEGLTRMVQKSLEFRMSMSSVASIAEKVFSPESAIDLAANLQVLGGAIGAFNDPLKLTYMATNDMEGLQDALIGAAGSLASYNDEQKRFEVTGVNLRRAKEMAGLLNIDLKELNNIAIASAERTQASAAMFAQGINVDEKDREFLTNLSRMKDGKMVIEIPEGIAKKLNRPTEIALDEFNQTIADQLLENRDEFKDMNTKDIAMKQLTETEQMSRDMSVLVSYATLEYARKLKGGAGEVYQQAEMDNIISKLKERAVEFRGTGTAQEQKEQGSDFVKKIVEPIKTGAFIEDIKNSWKSLSTGEQRTSQVIEKKVTYRHEFYADNVLDKIRTQSIQNSAMGVAFNDEDPDDMRQYEKASKAERMYIS